MITSDFTTDTIISTIEEVMNLATSKVMSEQEIGQKVFQLLTKGKTDKRPKAKKNDVKIDSKHIDMKNYLLNN